MDYELRHSVCPHDCPSTCALEVERIDNRTIGRVRGAPGNSYTSGVICAKVARYSERVHHPERLMHPLIRVGEKGEGKFAQISWNEALDRVAQSFIDKVDEYGSETVWPYFFAGTMGIIQRDGIQRLRHVMGYSRQAANICTELVQNGWIGGAGGPMGPDPREMAESDLIIIWGGNPVSTQVNVMTHVTKARKDRGARLVVVDAYKSPTAEIADELVLVKPGTDGAVATAIMHVLFRDGFADIDYMEKHTDDWISLEKHLVNKTPKWAEEISGVPANQIEMLAALISAFIPIPSSNAALGHTLSTTITSFCTPSKRSACNTTLPCSFPNRTRSPDKIFNLEAASGWIITSGLPSRFLLVGVSVKLEFKKFRAGDVIIRKGLSGVARSIFGQ